MTYTPSRETHQNSITIYTDGSSIGNPGPGGWGAVLLAGSQRKELSGGFRLTTNNRMELTAVIESLKALKQPCQVTLYSDSKYVVDAVNQGWALRWRANRWKRGKQGKALNPDLWQELLDLLEQHAVTFVWVKGHADTPENQRCDKLAVAAAKKPNLPADAGYERADEAKPLSLF
jgi:ribonuclease HI